LKSDAVARGAAASRAATRASTEAVLGPGGRAEARQSGSSSSFGGFGSSSHSALALISLGTRGAGRAGSGGTPPSCGEGETLAEQQQQEQQEQQRRRRKFIVSGGFAEPQRVFFSEKKRVQKASRVFFECFFFPSLCSLRILSQRSPSSSLLSFLFLFPQISRNGQEGQGNGFLR